MKRKKPSLPRLSLLSFNRKDLLAFVGAVEALRHLVDDLRIISNQLAAAPRRNGKPARKPAVEEASPRVSAEDLAMMREKIRGAIDKLTPPAKAEEGGAS